MSCLHLRFGCTDLALRVLLSLLVYVQTALVQFVLDLLDKCSNYVKRMYLEWVSECRTNSYSPDRGLACLFYSG